MVSVRLLLGILCALVIGWSGLRSGSILRSRQPGTSILRLSSFLGDRSVYPRSPYEDLRQRVIQIAQAQLGVREATGNNDGVVVENYLHYTGNTKGEPWCAAFVSWIYGQAGLKFPRTAWSPSLFLANRRVDTPQTADVFGVYFPGLKRIAHCGLVKSQRGSWLLTIEGNTNVTGSREGDGVYTKYRHKRTIMYYADWLKGGGM